MKPEADNVVKDKHLLIAVDETDSSRRAVLYVADFLGGFPGFAITLLSIIPDSEPDFFDSEAAMNDWLKKELEAANKMLKNYQQVLIQSGFPENKVRYRACMGESKSMADVGRRDSRATPSNAVDTTTAIAMGAPSWRATKYSDHHEIARVPARIISHPERARNFCIAGVASLLSEPIFN